MEVSKSKKKLLRLPSAHGVFSKVRAVFSTTQAAADESEQVLCSPACVPFEARATYQLEAECARAKAQEMAQRSRQRMA